MNNKKIMDAMMEQNEKITILEKRLHRAMQEIENVTTELSNLRDERVKELSALFDTGSTVVVR